MKYYLLLGLILLSGCGVKRAPCSENCGGENTEQTQEQEEAGETQETFLELLANEQSGTATVPLDSRVLISWGAGSYEDCLLTPGDLTGISGSFLTEPLTENLSFEITCHQEDGTEATATLDIVVE